MFGPKKILKWINRNLQTARLSLRKTLASSVPAIASVSIRALWRFIAICCACASQSRVLRLSMALPPVCGYQPNTMPRRVSTLETRRSSLPGQMPKT